MSTLETLAPYIAWTIEQDNAVAQRRNELEGQGFKIVQHSLTDPDGPWEIWDWHDFMRELPALAIGVGSEAMDSAWRRHWLHVDGVGGDYELTAPSESGLSEETQHDLVMFVWDHADELEAAMRKVGIALPDRVKGSGA